MSTQKNLTSLCAAAVFALGLAACGGGGSTPAPDYTLDDAQMGVTVEAGTHTVSDDLADAFPADAAMYLGQNFATGDIVEDVGGLDFACTAGPCSVTVNDDGTITTTGTIEVVMMGGEFPTAMRPDPEPTEPAGPTVADLFTTAQTSSDNAEAAGKAASAGVAAAKKASGELGLINVAGESMTEYMKAKAILDGQQAVMDAVDDAQEALDNANEAKTHAEALDDGAQKTALLEALEDAIEAAEQAVEDATDARDGRALKSYVDLVTGGDDADPQGTPASLAKTVAEAVGEALGGMTTDAGIPVSGSGNGLVLGSTTNNISTDAADIPVTTGANAVKGVTSGSNSKGMTWAMIVGDDVMTKPLGTITGGTFTAGNAGLKVASLTGMDASAVDKTATPVLVSTGTFADGMTYGSPSADGSPGTEYMGIPGVVFCLGSDCEVGAAGTANAGKLVGSWYFAPSEASTRYVNREDDATTDNVDESLLYMAETLYVRYGYWLTYGDRDQADDTDASNDAAVLNRYIVLSGADAATTVTLDYSNPANKPDSATYTGPAIGMSVHKVLDPDGDVTSIDSGSFTADAELILRFGDGADITLGGTIDNFQGNAVDPDDKWTVELERATFTAGDLAGAGNDGKTVASGRNGVWTATAYGAADSRPTGIFGAFNAHFSDGHAAGVYVTD